MFVKIAHNLIANAGHISLIKINDDYAELFFDLNLTIGKSLNNGIVIPLAAAHNLLAALDVNMAIDLEMKPENYTRTLTSQIAQALRDNFPNGATADQLSDLTNADATAIYEALESLTQERVALCVHHDPATGDEIWFHASNAPKSTPDAPPLADFNSNESFYYWECPHHTPPHVRHLVVSDKEFQAGITYCDICAAAHTIPNETLALHGAPTLAPTGCGYVWYAHDVDHPCTVPPGDKHTAHVLGRCDICLAAITSTLDPSRAAAPLASNPGSDSETK